MIKSSNIFDPVKVSRFATNVKRLGFSKKVIPLWVSSDHSRQGKSPAELFLSKEMPGWLDLLLES